RENPAAYYVSTCSNGRWSLTKCHCGSPNVPFSRQPGTALALSSVCQDELTADMPWLVLTSQSLWGRSIQATTFSRSQIESLSHHEPAESSTAYEYLLQTHQTSENATI